MSHDTEIFSINCKLSEKLTLCKLRLGYIFSFFYFPNLKFLSYIYMVKILKFTVQFPIPCLELFVCNVTPGKVTWRHRWPLTAEVICLVYSVQRNWFIYSWGMELLTVSSVYSRIFSKNSQARRWKQTHLCVPFSVSGVSSQLLLSASSNFMPGYARSFDWI